MQTSCYHQHGNYISTNAYRVVVLVVQYNVNIRGQVRNHTTCQEIPIQTIQRSNNHANKLCWLSPVSLAIPPLLFICLIIENLVGRQTAIQPHDMQTEVRGQYTRCGRLCFGFHLSGTLAKNENTGSTESTLLVFLNDTTCSMARARWWHSFFFLTCHLPSPHCESFSTASRTQSLTGISGPALNVFNTKSILVSSRQGARAGHEFCLSGRADIYRGFTV